MIRYTIQELQCFDAVVTGGSFQAAAELLHRSHPSVFAAIAKLEQQLGLNLLDRSGYRVRLTEEGRAFHRRARSLLRDSEELQEHAAQLAMGEEAELRIVLGDLCPLAPMLEWLSRFFAQHSRTRLHLQFEAVTGPWERLLENEADLIVHRVPHGETRIESIDLGRVAMVPVVKPGFLPFTPSGTLTPKQLRSFTQCVLRDSARAPSEAGHYVIDSAPQCSVPDQLTKKELILHGLAWGHLPRFLIENELRNGSLVSIAGRHFPGVTEKLVAARRRDEPNGPVAIKLWEFLSLHAPILKSVIDRAPRSLKTATRKRPKR